MERNDRLPSVPLICSDPYFSVWMPADTMTQTDSTHWSGPIKPITGEMTVDGAAARFLGTGSAPEAAPAGLEVTPTRTRFGSEFGNVRLETTFLTPALPDDWDLLSMPIALVSFRVTSLDGNPHVVSLKLNLSDRLCYDGDIRPDMFGDHFELFGQHAAMCGQRVQKPLNHSGDHITIDWGYLYLLSPADVSHSGCGLELNWSGDVNQPQEIRAVIGYDDIASINYFGDLCKAWYRRNGAQITDALHIGWEQFDEITRRCEELDARVLSEACEISDDYALIAAAAWRACLGAHKLIATPKGEPALLSKENDSNGCIGTVDVSYPTSPLLLKYSPELVNALCRPVLEFASMPVWKDDFAPHDVGRYPWATGQVYGTSHCYNGDNGMCPPPYYLLPASANVYDFREQMPVEECGNMLIMLAAAREFGANASLADQYRNLLDQWVHYLVKYGEDPGEQLCTDDFAGHLAHNVNLAAKAIVGVACYGLLTNDDSYRAKAQEMARRLMDKIGKDGRTPLTLDGQGWSMKYNLLWDKVLGLNLLPDEFYKAETESYLSRMNAFGLPLDSRADYTKSDWICWAASLAADPECRRAILSPLARFLRESDSRVAFSDWYDTKTGRYIHFIGRPVLGGVFAPLLPQK